jgi:hypothetical protein
MTRLAFLAVALAVLLAEAAPAPSADGAMPPDGPEDRWDIRLEHFFVGGTKPLWLYGRARGGQWVSVAGSSRDDERGPGKKSYNRSWYYADFSRIPLQDGRLKGTFTLHVTPDLWVPRDHKPYTVDIAIDARVQGKDKMDGTWKLLAVHSKDESATFGQSGKVNGSYEQADQPPMPDPVTFECNMQGALVGGDPDYGGRCMVLRLGFEGGRFTSAMHGGLSQKWEVYGLKGFDPAACDLSATRDRLHGRVVVPTRTLDMEPCTYIFEIDGRPIEGYVVGLYKLTVKIDGKPDVTIDGSFDGTWAKGITRMAAADDRPWFAKVQGRQPVAEGEHPRLLFRRSDLPALRKKVETPEGKAILARLRAQLDGADGDTMTTRFNPSTAAYQRKSKEPLPLGTYTFGHAAGYGLLYQVTGEKKYADFGRQCFEKALAGVRDRDDRYSFRDPGGALRAGPVVGWYAVGYDLCCDGWDAKARERFGRALAEYEEGEGRKAYDLEALARGTMPPGSNHFGMQIGGASLALLALDGEPFVDADRQEVLLKIAARSVVRNLSEGFGDGGCFAEGDGTGSMSSQIAYLTALSAWKHVKGRDYVNVDRPNARMLTLKWVYQTVFRDGKPDFWPIRGAYGHNVWSRQGLSGAGYYAIGIGAVPPEHRAAMTWCYERFLLEADTKAGGPYDTVSWYPHHSVCAFVNWPVGMEPEDPNAVLPHVYRDTACGFYCWRNRWKDAGDTVITVLTNRTEGYMGAKPDKGLCVNAGGEHLRWGSVKEGETEYWWSSPRGQTSSLRLAGGTCFAVDFTGASGADVMLVTTGKADGPSVTVGGLTLTFAFPGAAEAPRPEARGEAAVVGRQTVTVEDGHLVLAVKGR